MTDEALVDAFERCTLPPEQFSHVAHVRVAWWYLRRFGLAGAVERFPVALRRFATQAGAPDKYHQTITIVWLLLIEERLDGHADASWDAFATAHPELFVSRPSILSRYYRDETLQSARARRAFVMPDKG